MHYIRKFITVWLIIHKIQKLSQKSTLDYLLYYAAYMFCNLIIHIYLFIIYFVQCIVCHLFSLLIYHLFCAIYFFHCYHHVYMHFSPP